MKITLSENQPLQKALSCIFGHLQSAVFFVLVSESNLEKAKLEAKEAVAKQIKVSLDFEIEEVGTCM